MEASISDTGADSEYTTIIDEEARGWRWVANLGEGATANVSVWENSETKDKLAIKVSTRRRFSRRQINYWMKEVTVMSKLRHLNVVRGYALPDEIRSQLTCKLPPLAMEYCSGGSLREFCRHYRQGVPEDELREIVRDICAGLRYLHRKHIVHRDIKPDNIVIQKAERFVYKITDLGYMKVLDPRSITRSFIGTAAYAAPEILESGSHVRKYNYLVDYWSLGVTVFEVATGFRPFRDIPTCGKKQDTIWGRRTLMGIEYFNELPVRCKFTPSFGRLLTKWLQTMLQHHPPHRNPDLSLTPLDAMIRFVAVTEKRVDVRLPSMANQDLDEEPMQEAARAAHERKAKKFQTL